MIYLGIDDTDVVGSPGTNQLARAIVRRLEHAGSGAIICRHQLLFDPRVPYTTKNGSASIQLPNGDAFGAARVIDTVKAVMRERYVEGSDPGLAMSTTCTPDMLTFGARAKTDVVTQSEARRVAAAAGCFLEGLGGTQQGVVGALAAIALVAGGQDGRVVHVADWPWPDALSGVQPVSILAGRGVSECRSTTGRPFTGDYIDVGKHLRPNWREGRIVLFVEPPRDGGAEWRAVRLD